ncbi:hypothetical protein PLESTB_001724000 [Pleodorina starrii]|uniref:Autophagy-related protein 16 domain-containing protein n=1 Tax=Pleodorina starrii TaxID=330485 RepID=A0A9W6F9C0_9CHLO|nr:hypothetical protein PLESTM_002008900 [Pleodorina starrii]GLC61154.1 hypothetical protein PLESTB_001724000 [Pleodorina starrii]GLC70108.1 hypothetical protein PLESTF_000925000 [Pleodorina starrii]
MQTSPLAVAPEWVVASCVAQLRHLYDTRTAPFVAPFADYSAGLQRSRELEVRLLQLDKEGAELRDENASLHSRLAAVDLAAAAATAAQLEEARAALSRAERELGSLYRDKANLLEEVVGASAALTTTRSALESSSTQLAQSRAEVSALREQLSALGASLESERAARVAAASELAAALGARDGALAEAERLRHENAALLRTLMEMKEGEAGRMNEVNRMHNQLLEREALMRQEAELDRQATELIRQRAVAEALSSVAAAAATAAAAAGPMGHQPPSAATSVLVAAPPLAAAAPAGAAAGLSGDWVGAVGAAASAAVPPGGAAAAAAPPPPSLPVPTSLRDVMGLLAGSPSAAQRAGGGGGGTAVYDMAPRPPELRVPSRVPVAVVAPAHRGGCNSLAPQSPGHFVASCGADRTVALWDVAMVAGPGCLGAASASASASMSGSMMGAAAGYGGGGGGGPPKVGPAITLSGMTAAVNDCAFTCDAAQVVAAGSDRALLVWDATSGRHRHTLTGHSGPVTAVALSPLDCRLAVSVSEDRSFKLWDLGRGFSVRSVPCARMPLCLAISRDGNTVVTGHLDGSVLLWDVRQCRAGAAAALVEHHDQSHPVVCVTPLPSWSDSALLLAARDGSVRLWDFRGAATMRTWRQPGFSLGTCGGTGRPRCHLGVSPDGRLLAAGAADGSVWVWDLRNTPSVSQGSPGQGAQPRQLRGGPGGGPVHLDAVVATAFSADMTALLSADKAGGLAFWPLE